MLLVYMSLTGQTRKFVQKFDWPSIEITMENAFSIEVKEDYLLIVPTYANEVTEIVNDFLETGNNQAYCRGVCGGGNRNFNELFCFTAKDISEDYGVPLVHCFEFQGSDFDVETVKEKVKELA
ncbi:class Ib ribonucleoside-diphosphate reductase assembly flavoprotein NrdI [Atopobacter sp. AH10]|uniref:class Ib ribonucleoside-diphosphate reductase assembly flavoprotein NrdI n=1 Tax=Atopobacter sp. AH10 TaxID=2315861 RepID=UPI000EF2770A|nr:class Ib ribonucleoside-diphosphate reductase assembly flavoprotein NrdI [Atopobacter sp. AH10]RLK62414.1 class Ib ribonucleoside-diphosphate reductase assembly flavoprotein NrdI [Atopobacter sp. AH10]